MVACLVVEITQPYESGLPCKQDYPAATVASVLVFASYFLMSLMRFVLRGFPPSREKWEFIRELMGTILSAELFAMFVMTVLATSGSMCFRTSLWLAYIAYVVFHTINQVCIFLSYFYAASITHFSVDVRVFGSCS